MKIWTFNHYAGTPDITQATRSFDIGRQLVKGGHAITIFASSFSEYSLQEERLQKGESCKIETCEGVRFVWIKTFPYSANNWRRIWNMLSYAWGAFWTGNGIKEKPDLIIGTCVHPLAVLSAYALSRIKKSRFFFEITDLWPQTLVDMGAISNKNPITQVLRILEKFLLNKAERIIILMPQADTYITSLGVPKEKIVWIPNGIDILQYSNIQPYTGGNSCQFIAMYLGRHGVANAIDISLQAARLLQDKGNDNIKFIFVGDGPERQNLMQLSRDLGLRNVEFRERVPKYQVPAIMGEADAFLFTLKNISVISKYGIGGNKICDYLLSGRPIIFSCDSVNNPVAEANAGITIPSENPNALAEAIVRLAAMKPQERFQMGENGAAYAKKNYDIAFLAAKLENLL